ncbi:MAG: hypothetical protein HY855_11685 [Burkholderiales bacterium]|nr:hypothetical protein [Burkholderiales bacterium]
MSPAAPVIALAGILLAGPALAQQVDIEPSRALGCLTPAAAQRGAPDYPHLAYKRERPGRVKVELLFAAPDAAPEVKVVETVGDDDQVDLFIDAVKRHVRSFRVPCLDASGDTARLSFDYVFKPDDRRVIWNEPTDLDRKAVRAMVSCVIHTGGKEKPDYPLSALNAGLQGRVLSRLRFEAPDKPPAAEVFSRPSARLLRYAIEHWVERLRMPCHDGKRPIEATWSFSFVLEGESYGFRPGLSLRQVLPMVRGIHEATLAHDFTTMGCPFDVTLQYRRPDLPNLVGERGDHDPARRPFLDWLARVEFDLPRNMLDAVYGDTLEFQVPCVKLNLNPT